MQAQLRIAAGETVADLGLAQDTVELRGAALQCRITTEDPANGFRPGTGVITTYRSPGGAGVRVDSGTAYSGAEITAHFDSITAAIDGTVDRVVTPKVTQVEGGDLLLTVS